MVKIFDVGVNDGKYQANKNGKSVKEYALWFNILARCYNEKCRNKNLTYSDCTVSTNFLSYSYFYEWCHEQVGFGNDGWQLDKDVLVKGNKIYSEDMCVFIPRHINCLLTKSNKTRGNLPIGVSYAKLNRKYKVQAHNHDSKVIHLGLYTNIEDAFYTYKEFKENVVKTVANKYKDNIDIRVYNALMCYNVEITD